MAEDESTALTMPEKRVIMDKCVSRHFEIYVLMVLTRMGIEIFMSYVQINLYGWKVPSMLQKTFKTPDFQTFITPLSNFDAVLEILRTCFCPN